VTRRRDVALIVLAACASLLGACGGGDGSSPAAPLPPSGGGPPPAAGSSAWGFFNYTGDFAGGLTNARLGRATGILWAGIERPPGSGSYDWADLDARVRNAQSAGFSGVLVLKAGNGSAFSDPACFQRVQAAPDDAFSNGRALSSCPVRPEMEQAWGRMVGALVERYDGDGAGDMPSLSTSTRVDIQVENEAANSELWDYGETDRAASADRYMRLLEISHQAKQGADPGTQLILAGLIQPNLLARCDGQGGPGCGALAVQRNLTFTKRILTRPALFDAVDVHVFVYYRFEPSYIDAGLGWVADQMRQLGYEKPVYSLEWTGAMMLHVASEGHADAFASYFPYSGEFPSPAAFQAMYAALDQPQNAVYREWFEAEQAGEFAKLFTNMLALGVRRLVHVQYADFRPGAPWDNVWWNWQGVIKYVAGAPIRKPSYYTYNILAGRLAGFSSARRVGPDGDVRLYEFTFPSAEPAYVLWMEGGTGLLDLDAVMPRNNVRVTRLVTELDGSDQPIVPAEQTVPATAVPAGDVPVLLRPVD
jgi:hypothetical protein